MKSARWLAGMLTMAVAMAIVVGPAAASSAAEPGLTTRMVAPASAAAPMCVAPPTLLMTATASAQVPFCEDVCTYETPCDTSCRVVGVTTCRVWGTCDYWAAPQRAKKAGDARATQKKDACAVPAPTAR